VATVLIGFMGAGKSTAARELAGRLRTRALDSDEELEARLGRGIAEEFERSGESAFREREEQVVLELLSEAEDRAVVSLGGGSVLSARVQEALREHLVVLLEIDAAGAWERMGAGAGTSRPLARERERFFALHEERQPLYEELADAILPARATAVGLRALPALEALRLAPAGTKMVWAGAASGEYPVLVGEGLIAGRTEQEPPGWWPLPHAESRAYCVTDETVGKLYGRCLGHTEASIAMRPGESQKTLDGVELVLRALAKAQMTRTDHVVALGGGVVGDLAGFCAATYQRGVPVIQVPTTLVAQVDSAYGGKTGVDLPEAKNYVGAYHQPYGVIVDPKTLATLPERELAAGWVEVMKTAIIAGAPLWRRVVRACAGGQAGGAPAIAAPSVETIIACARTKLAIVAADERDAGPRQALNLGHTVGHAIETASGYTRYLHGEAVGLGLLAALRLSGAAELRDEVERMLERLRLPTRLCGVSLEQVLAATRRDKKRLGSGPVPFVLARAPGEVEVGAEVAAEELRSAVQELIA
jgi:3-dehydroquinate synthetase/shikimate kinase